MAKRNNNTDGTPIEFYIPGPGKSSKIPIPTNRPHWKYKEYKKTRPTAIEWGVTIFTSIVLFVFGIVVLNANMPLHFEIILALFIIFLSIGFVSALFRREKYYQENKDLEKEGIRSKKREKGQPKRRKDYG